MIKLHGFQHAIMDEASAHFRAGDRRVLVQAPTGSGKTVIVSRMMASAASRNFPSYFVVHRRELLAQASRAFCANGVRHGIIATGIAGDPKPLIQIATVTALARQRDNLRPPRFVCWDETHHLPAPGWSSLQDVFADAFQIGLTATPIRLDGQGLRNHFDAMVCGPSVRWLQKRGFLARCHHFAPSVIDLTGVRTRMGDFVRSDLTAAVKRSSIDADAVKAYLRFAQGKRSVVFATSIDHSETVVAAFRAAGIAAEHVDGATSAVERDAAIARFTRGDTQVLSNVDLFGEGFDVPAIECVILLRATQSVGLYLQMIGRALRPAPGKSHAIVIDLVGNYRRHGLVEEDREWSLDAPPQKAKDRDDLLVCAACDGVAIHYKFCSVCGAPPKPRRHADIETWNALIREPGLARRLRGMSYGAAVRWADDEQKIKLMAMARCFKNGWIWHQLQELQRRRAA
jgi:superfamily II DNA or RNA helicase